MWRSPPNRRHRLERLTRPVAQAIDDAKPDAILSLQFGTDLLKFVREGDTRGIFKNRFVVNLLAESPNISTR